MVDYNRSTARGFQNITSLSAATALTPPTGAAYAVIVAETQAVRWRGDGVDPTASVGMLMQPGDILNYDGDLASLRFIEVTAGAAISVAYFT